MHHLLHGHYSLTARMTSIHLSSADRQPTVTLCVIPRYYNYHHPTSFSLFFRLFPPRSSQPFKLNLLMFVVDTLFIYGFFCLQSSIVYILFDLIGVGISRIKSKLEPVLEYNSNMRRIDIVDASFISQYGVRCQKHGDSRCERVRSLDRTRSKLVTQHAFVFWASKYHNLVLLSSHN